MAHRNILITSPFHICEVCIDLEHTHLSNEGKPAQLIIPYGQSLKEEFFGMLRLCYGREFAQRVHDVAYSGRQEKFQDPVVDLQTIEINMRSLFHSEN